MANTQYVGPDKVLGVSVEEMKTPLGNEIVKVMFTDGTSRLMTKKCFDLVVTEMPAVGDYNYIQAKKFDSLIPMVVDLVLEYDLNYYEIGRFGQTLVDQIFERFHRASHFLWSGTDEGYIAGADFLNKKTVLDALKIIATIPPKHESEQSGMGTTDEVGPGAVGGASS